jgi:hypothetical protein
VECAFEQLTLLDSGSAPQRVLNTHSSDQVAHFFADPWPATARTGFPSPVRGEAHAMPTHTVSGLTMVTASSAGTATIEPNEQGPVGPRQKQSAWCAPLQDIELMPQYRISSSRRRDLKQSHSTQTKRKAIEIMRRSCSDSPRVKGTEFSKLAHGFRLCPNEGHVLGEFGVVFERQNAVPRYILKYRPSRRGMTRGLK